MNKKQLIKKISICLLINILLLYLIINIAYYYNSIFLVIILIPSSIILNILNNITRDYIIKIRNGQVLVATASMIMLSIVSILIAYFIFTTLANEKDLIELILNFVAKFIDVENIKTSLGI